MAKKVKKSKPIYNSVIIAIDESMEKKLSDKLIDGIIDGIEENLFGTFQISHEEDEEEQEYLVNSMFEDGALGALDIDVDIDHIYSLMFDRRDRRKVKHALEVDKDIYIGVVDLDESAEYLQNVYNDLFKTMEKSDQEHFKLIQKLKFDSSWYEDEDDYDDD